MTRAACFFAALLLPTACLARAQAPAAVSACFVPAEDCAAVIVSAIEGARTRLQNRAGSQEHRPEGEEW